MLPTTTARTTVYVCDYDLSYLGVAISSVEAFEDAAVMSDEVEQMEGRAGEILTGAWPRAEALVLELDGHLLAETYAELKANLDTLKTVCRRGLVEVRMIDRTDRVVRARCTAIRHPVVSPQFVNRGIKLGLTFRAHDPVRFESSGSVVAFGATAAVLPLGGWPSTPKVFLLGGATDPRLSLYDKTGAEIGYMAFTVTLAATDYLELDFDGQVIWKYVSGVRSSGMALLTDGWWFPLDPIDEPSMGVSAGSGVAHYRRVWP